MPRPALFRRLLPACLLALALAACAPGAGNQATPPPPGAALRAQRTLDLAAGTVELLLGGEQGEALRMALASARAVLVAPRVVKAGFLLGGTGGHALVVARGEGGAWGAPAFVRLSGGSAGLQAGVSETAFILAAQDEPTRDALLQDGFAFDAEALAAAPGRGGERQASSMTYDGGAAYFSVVDGLFAGVALDGTALFADTEANAAVYGPGATPRSVCLGPAAPPAWAARLLDLLPPSSR